MAAAIERMADAAERLATALRIQAARERRRPAEAPRNTIAEGGDTTAPASGA